MRSWLSSVWISMVSLPEKRGGTDTHSPELVMVLDADMRRRGQCCMFLRPVMATVVVRASDTEMR